MTTTDDQKPEDSIEAQVVAGGGFSLPAGSPDWEDDDDDRCHFCGGDGCVFGEDLDDPLWYDPETIYRCPCCNGSGEAKDCTFW